MACVKAQYYSLDIAKADAVEMLTQEVKFINFKLGANCHVDPFTTLLTLDFSSTDGYSGDFKSSGVTLKAFDKEKLEDNPYVILAPFQLTSKEHFLRCEPFFVEALVTKNPAAFWRYFETLLTPLDYPSDQNFPVVSTVSDILLGNAEYHFKNKILEPYITNAFVNSRAQFVGVSRDQKIKMAEGNWDEDDFNFLRQNIKHPFMNHLLDIRHNPFTKDQLMTCKSHYEQVLWETKSERNFDTHIGKRNDKASLLVKHTLPRFCTRLRWLLLDAIEKHDGKPFHVISKLLSEEGAQLLIKRKV